MVVERLEEPLSSPRDTRICLRMTRRATSSLTGSQRLLNQGEENHYCLLFYSGVFFQQRRESILYPHRQVRDIQAFQICLQNIRFGSLCSPLCMAFAEILGKVAGKSWGCTHTLAEACFCLIQFFWTLVSMSEIIQSFSDLLHYAAFSLHTAT